MLGVAPDEGCDAVGEGSAVFRESVFRPQRAAADDLGRGLKPPQSYLVLPQHLQVLGRPHQVRKRLAVLAGVQAPGCEITQRARERLAPFRVVRKGALELPVNVARAHDLGAARIPFIFGEYVPGREFVFRISPQGGHPVVQVGEQPSRHSHFEAESDAGRGVRQCISRAPGIGVQQAHVGEPQPGADMENDLLRTDGPVADQPDALLRISVLAQRTPDLKLVAEQVTLNEMRELVQQLGVA